MKIRKPNQNNPITNNQGNDYVVVDGILSPAEIAERGQIASQRTIDLLKTLYPKSPEKELLEREMMANEQLNKELQIYAKENNEKIEEFYLQNQLTQKIKETKSEIDKINKKIEKSKEVNLIYEKERRIRELEEELRLFKNKSK